MLKRITWTIVQSRGLKNQVKINWKRPDYVPAYKPEKSGDLEPLPSISEHTIGGVYALSEEIKDAPESVKKIFSVGFLGKKELYSQAKKELMDRVKRHKYDDELTTETKIARLTALIRYHQDIMEKHPRNSVCKVVVQEIIDKRKKHLKFLRQADYKKFEWLLEKLNIEYKAHPESFHKLTRRESLRKLTEMHCDDIRNQKLDSYRNLLESQQGPFLKSKLEALKFIRKEQKELQLTITVTEQDITKVEKQFEEWKARDEIKKKAQRKRRNLVITEE